MKTFKVKFNILLYGFPPLINEYIVDNFKLKKQKIKENVLVPKFKSKKFDTSSYISYCAFQLVEDNNFYYNYFESVKKTEIYIPNELNLKKDIYNYILTKSIALEIINNLEKKLRLQFNLRIVFPNVKIYVYDNMNKLFGHIINNRTLPVGISLEDINLKDFELNSHQHISLESFSKLEKQNARFKRAMNYYYSSFDSEDISIRFILLFSSLEALLIRSKISIWMNLASRVSKILRYIDNYEEQKIFERIKYLYDIRSKYIHGSKKGIISKEDEEELRDYVRSTLIIYWGYSINNNLSSNQIITNIANDIKFDFRTRMLAKYLKVTDYKKAYFEMCIEIANGIKKGNFEITEIEDGVIKSVNEIK